MFVEDLRRTFRAWATQPLLPLIVLGLGMVAAVADLATIPGFAVAVPLGVFWIGFLGTQRVWYARAFEGRGLRPGEAFELSARFFGRYVTLGISAILIAILPALALGVLGLPAWVRVAAGTFVADVCLTFVTSAASVGDERASAAYSTGWQLLRTGLPGCLPHAVLPPLALYAVANGRGWLILVAEFLALVARGVTTSYYLRNTVAAELPRAYGEQRGPACFG